MNKIQSDKKIINALLISKPIKYMHMVIIWSEVFDFAKKVTSVALDLLVRELKSLSPETQISLAIITADEKAIKMLFKEIEIAIRQKQIKILSAIGSNILPRSEVRLFLLARNPSRKSVMPLNSININPKRYNSKIILIKINGANKILDNVINNINFFISNISLLFIIDDFYFPIINLKNQVKKFIIFQLM